MSDERIAAPSRDWFHIPLQIVVAGLCVYWYLHLPAPNKAVLWLGGVAALMALVDMRPLHKAVYFALIMVLIFTENRAINKDRRDFAQDEQSRRLEENRHFADIGGSITANVGRLLDKSDAQFRATTAQQGRQFEATMKKANENIDQITGGNSYVVAMPDTTDNTGSILPLLIKVCDTCEQGIANAAIFLQNNLSDSSSGVLIYNGAVNPNSAFLVSQVGGLLRDKENIVRISVLARNKPTVEILRIRFNQAIKEWEFSYGIMREEKRAHLNPKTNMAEGEAFKMLVKDTEWMRYKKTPSNQSTITVH